MCSLSEQDVAQLQALKAALGETEESELPSDEFLTDVEEQVSYSTGRTLSVGVVSIMAYLVGVPEDQFGKKYKRSVYEELDKNDRAKIVRSLCSIRNAIMRAPGKITTLLKHEMKSLDTMPDVINPDLFSYLTEQRITIITGTKLKAITEYIAIINNHISNQVGACEKLFPAWVKWEYVKDCLVMPSGGKPDRVQAAVDRLQSNFNSYPFQCYMNWPVDDPKAYVEEPENYAAPMATGNVLCNDKKFLVLLYRVHNDEFQDFGRVFDASEEAKHSVTDYMLTHDDITVLVDCENSDPYKLCAMLDFLKEEQRDLLENPGKYGEDAHFGSIRKIVLFDDYHTIDAWDVLENYTRVEIDHQEVERVLNHKSLVDMAMAVGACKEHFCNNVNSFMVASSDSDYWGLMRALPDADFMVLAERSKFSHETEHFYEDHEIKTCFMDDFAGNLTKIKEGALRYSLEKHMNNMITVNLYDTLSNMYDELRLDMSFQERENYRKQLARKLHISVDDQGEISFHIDV